MKFFLLLFGLICAQISSVYANVVVTSKPLYFIIAPLIKEIDTPKILVSHGHCGHHHHLRPSEIKLIKNATLVFWSGPVHEPFMAKIIRVNNNNIKVFEENKGFAWLSIGIILKKLPMLTARLKKIYPQKVHAQIDANALKFQQKLINLSKKISLDLSTLKTKAFLITYPFLSYFAKEYGINIVGYMMDSPDAAVTPRRLKSIYKLLEEKEITGVIKDHHVPLNVIHTVVGNQCSRILTVDPEAINVPVSIDGYHILIERITQSIVKWAQ
ncbi:MAG: zinc ABC transporter substrate-binding protein [Candidatus Paracaedibacteraceae bacterium]|nr:zinc ABC transporter substrate-binding protein [Candidatus Paracaedibacteraceae bacterium]